MASLTQARRWRTSAGMAGTFVLLLSANLAAQQPVGAIAGVIRDSDGKPIANVEVRVAARARSTRSDTAGRYRVADVRAGEAVLSFRHFGYEPKSVPAVVVADRMTKVNVVLGPLVQELPGILVLEQEERAREVLQGFFHRMETMTGFFLTRRQIEQRNPAYLSDMLRLMPGAELRPASVGGHSVLRFARSSLPGRDCPPQYYVDGVMVYGFNIDDIEPLDIEGIEIYTGASRVPPEFNNSRIGTAICGVVVIWTRVPGA